MTGDLAAFIAARLGEDEAAAREAYYEGQRWLTEEEGVYRWPNDELVHTADRKADARHIARHDPARVLRRVEWTRHALNTIAALAELSPSFAHCLLCELAAEWSDHPDYRAEWKP